MKLIMSDYWEYLNILQNISEGLNTNQELAKYASNNSDNIMSYKTRFLEKSKLVVSTTAELRGKTKFFTLTTKGKNVLNLYKGWQKAREKLSYYENKLLEVLKEEVTNKKRKNM